MDINKINNICKGINNDGDSDKHVISLSKKECSAIQQECTHYEDIRAASIEALKIVQKNRGWVSDEAIVLIAEILCISVADVEGIATFYNQIFRQPVGRHIIRYCDSVVCYLLGCEQIKKVLMDILSITIGHTTIDNRFTLLPMSCVGVCNKAPIVMIDCDIYHHVISEKIIYILENYL